MKILRNLCAVSSHFHIALLVWTLERTADMSQNLHLDSLEEAVLNTQANADTPTTLLETWVVLKKKKKLTPD